MPYCKHCEKYLPARIRIHHCAVKGVLTAPKDKFLIEIESINVVVDVSEKLDPELVKIFKSHVGID